MMCHKLKSPTMKQEKLVIVVPRSLKFSCVMSMRRQAIKAVTEHWPGW